MVWNKLPLGEAQELAQRQAVGTAPFQPALAVNAFEVANQQHAEIAPRRQRRPPAPCRIEGRAQALHEAVERRLDQHRLKPVVENVTRRPPAVPPTSPPCPTAEAAADQAPSVTDSRR